MAGPAEAPQAGLGDSAATAPPPAPREPALRPSALDAAWRFFASPRLTIANLVLLLLALCASALIDPSSQSLAALEQSASGGGSRFYRLLELYDPLRSAWFTLLLTWIALAWLASSIEHLPRIWILLRHPEKQLERLRGLRFQTRGAREGEPVNELARAEQVLLARGYSVEKLPASSDGVLRLFAEKSRHTRFGIALVHLGLLLVLVGAIAGRLTAYEGIATVAQGGGETDAFVERKPDGSQLKSKLLDPSSGRPLLVRCDDFRLQEPVPGRPETFESDLRLFEKQPDGSAGRLLAQQTVRPGEPLRYGGLSLQSSSYRQIDEQMRARITLVDKASGLKEELLLGPGEPVQPAEGLRYQMVDYAPDFAGQGPAVQVQRLELPPGAQMQADGRPPPQAKFSSFWVFASRPSFDADNRDDRFAFVFDKLSQARAAVLRVSHDPSPPWFYAGALCVLAGVVLALAGAHRRVWAAASAGQLALGGETHRYARAFDREFAALCAALDLQLAPSLRAPPAPGDAP